MEGQLPFKPEEQRSGSSLTPQHAPRVLGTPIRSASEVG